MTFRYYAYIDIRTYVRIFKCILYWSLVYKLDNRYAFTVWYLDS